MIRRLHPSEERDSGATALEFALVFPIVLATMMFAFYGAMFFYYNAVAGHVARTMARQLSIPVSGNSTYPAQDTSSLTTDAHQVAGSLIPDPSDATAHSQGNDPTPAEGDLVTVTITYQLPVLSQLSSLVPGLSGISSISQSATERRQ